MLRNVPKVSIVITCYNYERYVEKAIESALAQTYKNLEIIVVDDGSTDASAEKIAAYGNRVHFIRQKNAGQAEAGYNGYLATSGEIVFFLDADDLLAPQVVEKVVRIWQDGCAKVQFDLVIIDGEGRDLGRRFCNFLTDYDAKQVWDDFDRWGSYLSPVLSGNAYARAYLEKILPLPRTRVLGGDVIVTAPDGDLNIAAPLYGTVITLFEQLGCYRLHDNNLDRQGATNAGSPVRFAKSVRRRYGEIETLKQHAAKQRHMLPEGNLLDYDLVYLNYRLMLKKLKHSYIYEDKDTPFSLTKNALCLLPKLSMPLKNKLAHGFWFLTLFMMPQTFANILILLRFNRAYIMWRALLCARKNATV